MRTLWQDIRYSVRVLARNPAFTAIVVVVLAIGIGANTAVFTMINTLLLRLLPGVADPRQLVLVTGEGGPMSLSYPHYEQLRDECRSFSGLSASAQICKRHLRLAGSQGVAESIRVQAVSANFFEILGVRAVSGRTLMSSDDRAKESEPIAVISYGFWQRRFGLDPMVIGSQVILDDVPFTIVGVAPKEFCGIEVGRSPDLWWPIRMVPRVDGQEDPLTSRGYTWLLIMGRLKPGVPQEQASAELSSIYYRIIDQESIRWRLSEDQRKRRLERKVELRPGGAGWTDLRYEFRRPLVVLMGTVGFVLLVACANLAGLLLAHGATRLHEFNVRIALGASRWILARQLLTESLFLAAVGGFLGLLLAQWGGRLLVYYIPGYGDKIMLKLTPDLHILVFTLLVSTSTGVLSGLVPAWLVSRINLAMPPSGRAACLTGTGLGQRWGHLFVALQIALSGCLLIGAGLFVRTFEKLNALDCGFNRERLMVFDLEIGKDYSHAQTLNLCRQVLQRLEFLPQVHCASLSSTRSLTGADGGLGSWKVVVDGAETHAGEGVDITSVCVTPRYFETMGITLLRGREFLPQDQSAALADGTSSVPPVAVVDETLARKLFGNSDPVGKYLRPLNRSMPLMEIVGVAKNARHYGFRDRPIINLYTLETNYNRGFLFFYFRTITDPSAVAPVIQQTVRKIDPTIEVAGLRMMSDVVSDHLFQIRAISQIASLFSVFALALACLGLYGTLSYYVSRWTHEIGIRMALGARAGSVLSLVIRKGMVLGVAGSVTGIIMAMALTRLISSQLYGITATDPLTFVGAFLILMIVALFACYLPARRAAKIDPMEALRYE